jgi:hypothetical protein
MAHISGKLGQVDQETIEITGIKSWTLDYTADLLDTTDFADDGTKSYIVGSTNWSGTFEGYKDGVPLAIAGAATVTLKLYESQTANQFWQGEAFIIGIHASTGVDGLVTYSYDYQGVGALTVAAA